MESVEWPWKMANTKNIKLKVWQEYKFQNFFYTHTESKMMDCFGARHQTKKKKKKNKK